MGGQSDEERALNVELFLVSAESRYLSYLLLIEDYLENNFGSRSWPLPPWLSSFMGFCWYRSGTSPLSFILTVFLPSVFMPTCFVAGQSQISGTKKSLSHLKDCIIWLPTEFGAMLRVREYGITHFLGLHISFGIPIPRQTLMLSLNCKIWRWCALGATRSASMT